jgi:hypothetical protein
MIDVVDEREMQISKRDGTMQKFVRLKLFGSLRRAGTAEPVAHAVSTELPVEDGESTTSIRRKVIAALNRKDPATAERYATAHRLKAVVSESAGAGQVRIHPETLAYFEIEPHAQVLVGNGVRQKLLQVFGAAEAGLGEARMTADQLKELGLKEGTKACIS